LIAKPRSGLAKPCQAVYSARQQYIFSDCAFYSLPARGLHSLLGVDMTELQRRAMTPPNVACRGLARRIGATVVFHLMMLHTVTHT
jgi:hypothetical protein